MPRKHKRESEDLEAGMKYNKIHHTKKVKTEDKGERKKEKNGLKAHFQFAFMFYTSSLNHSSKEDC